MATADFSLNMVLRGSIEEMISVLSIMKRYSSKDEPAYFAFASATIGGNTYWLDNIEDGELRTIIEEKSETVSISAHGPYGHYGVLNDVDIFRDMAEAVPGASFEGEITGSTTYTEQNLRCELKDRNLHISTCFESNDEGPDAYVEYFKEQLPYEEFTVLFKMDKDQFEEYDYEEFIGGCLAYEDDDITEMDYDSFIEELVDDCSSIDEEEFREVMDKLRERNISSYEAFIAQSDIGEETEFDYDPVAKAYVGRDKQVLKSNTVYNVNDDIRQYLEQNGLPHDDEAIAALSIEDVYDIIAGTYMKNTAAADESGEETATEEADAADNGIAIECDTTSQTGTVQKKSSKACLVWLVIVLIDASLTAVYLCCEPVKEAVNAAVSRIIDSIN